MMTMQLCMKKLKLSIPIKLKKPMPYKSMCTSLLWSRQFQSSSQSLSSSSLGRYYISLLPLVVKVLIAKALNPMPINEKLIISTNNSPNELSLI